MMENKKKPNPIDIHVGSRIRLRRTMLGMSQEKLGESLGITFQQIQKYVKGTNRVGASRLQNISSILNVPVSFFFEDAPGEQVRVVAVGEEKEGGNKVVAVLPRNLLVESCGGPLAGGKRDPCIENRVREHHDGVVQRRQLRGEGDALVRDLAQENGKASATCYSGSFSADNERNRVRPSRLELRRRIDFRAESLL